jgi:hypothetical protein
MNKLDFSDLNRFLVSVGLIFYAFAFAVPWLFLKESVSFKLSLQEFESLTPQSQSFLVNRTSKAELILTLIPWISLVLILFGTTAIVIGIRRWLRKQRIADEMESLDLQKKRSELKPISEEEVVEKAKLEVNQEGKNIVREGDFTVLKAPSHEKWQRVIDVEKLIATKLLSYNSFEYEVNQNVKIEGEEVVDILLSAYSPKKRDKLIEVKLFEQKIKFQSVIDAMQRLNKLGSAYLKILKKSPLMYLMIIYDSTIITKNEIERLTKAIVDYKKDNRLFHISVSFYSIDQIQEVNLEHFVS